MSTIIYLSFERLKGRKKVGMLWLYNNREKNKGFLRKILNFQVKAYRLTTCMLSFFQNKEVWETSTSWWVARCVIQHYTLHIWERIGGHHSVHRSNHVLISPGEDLETKATSWLDSQEGLTISIFQPLYWYAFLGLSIYYQSFSCSKSLGELLVPSIVINLRWPCRW